MSAGAPDPWVDAGHDFRAPLVALAVLSLLAGYADALALLQWDVFVANQSGNVVRTGMGLAGAEVAGDWRLSLLSIASFTLGGALSVLVGRRHGRLSPHVTRLGLAALLLVGWLAVVVLVGDRTDAPALTLALPALALGLIASTFVRLGAVPVTVTYATGAVLRLGQTAARDATTSPSDAAGRARRRQVLVVTLVLLVSYAGGGAVGTVAAARLGPAAHTAGVLVLMAAVVPLLRRVTPRTSAADGRGA